MNATAWESINIWKRSETQMTMGNNTRRGLTNHATNRK